MRIRKHARFSPLLYASSSLKPGTVVQTVCQLNQSPWDVMTFSPPSSPPPPPQSNGSGVCIGNGSSDSVGESGSFPRRSEYHDTTTADAVAEENEGTNMCCKTDGKGRQCGREVMEGNSLCEHHLSSVKSYSSVSHHHAGKKSVKPPPPAAAEALRRTRPKKAPASSSSSNSYEFYYYSGFGPKWGKRRGENRKKHGGIVEVEAAPAEVSYLGHEHFDFVEYEEEDDDDVEEGNNGRKRVRKPIKARSLKSLL